MCLAPENRRGVPETLPGGDLPLASRAALTLPAPPAPLRRPRLWDLDDKHHCPIIGSCLSLDELQRFGRRFGFGAKQGDAFALHVEAVGLARSRNPVSEALQRHLDRKFPLALRRFARFKSDAELRQGWHAALASGDVAGPLWALCTHKAASASTLHEAYADIHMLSHQLGAGHALDTRRLARLEKENAELKDEGHTMKGELAALLHQLAAAEARLEEHARHAAEHARLAERLQRFESGQVMIEMGQRLMTLQGAHERLAASAGRRWELERNLRDMREETARIATERNAALAERDALEQLLRAMEPPAAEPPGCARPGGEDCAGCANATDARCILYVGGRASLLAQYRQLAERLGITLLHHDGGREESLSRLPELIRGADAILCPTDQLSHNAYYHVKAHCKRVGKPCLFYKGSGVAGFAVAMARLNRGEYSLAGTSDAEP